MADQVGDPLGVLHVGLASRHVADVAGIADDQLKVPFQNRMDRLPVAARALHADMRDAQFLEPVPQPLQVPGHGRESSNLPARLAAGFPDQHTDDDRCLMDIETGTAFDDGFHDPLRAGGDRNAAGQRQKLVLTRKWVATFDDA